MAEERSIIKEAMIEYNQIVEAANVNAQKKLAEEFPEKFDNLLKEEIKKNNKKTKESYKKIDEVKESDKDKTKETKNDAMKDEKKKPINKGKKIEESYLQTEEFNVADINVDDENPDGGSENDDAITIEEIERELASMTEDEETKPEVDITDVMDTEVSDEENEPESSLEELIELRSKLDGIISQMGGDSESSEEIEITDDDIDNVDTDGMFNDESEPEVDEAHGVSYGARRTTSGRSLPNQNYLSQGEKDQSTYALQEAKKKLSGLINENKNLTKKLNEGKKYKTTVSSLLESYKTALEKYRKQLNEMAVFNTNLAYVNNILVNEELALTRAEKTQIIKEFKQIKTISESESKYKSVIAELKSNKKPIDESIEDKITTVISSSSSDKVIEKTAFNESENLKKILKNMNYYSGKKII